MNPIVPIRPIAIPEMGMPLSGGGGLVPGVTGPIPAAELRELGSVGQAPTTFGKLLSGFVDEVNAKQTAAGAALQGLVTGQNVSLHQAMITMQEAGVAFQLMVEVRNKMLQSYQELMRMQV